MDLRIPGSELNACVQCGLCLPHCPTYRVSGDELLSPRGRIQLMREVQDNGAPVTSQVSDAFATCVQCRGCEPACPSGVNYGQLIEATNTALATPRSTRRRRLMFAPLSRPRILRIGSVALAIAARLRLVPQRFGIPQGLPLIQRRHHASGSDVYLFTGCVMDAWQRDVHHASQRVIEATGHTVTPTGPLAPCCGALHAHGGLAPEARSRATATIAALSNDDRPILVNSAGCGAAMKEYGRLLGTDAAASFSSRVFDIQEWLAGYVSELPAVDPLPLVTAVQDPCHLRHVQRSHLATRTVLAPFVTRIVELDDEGLCCGAGGAYSVTQPELARQIRARKVSAINRVAPDVVASANPGCSMHLAAAGVTAVHPMVLIDQALHG